MESWPISKFEAIHGASEILTLLPSHIMYSTLLSFQTMEAWTVQGCA
jgi:hypothetical protein